MPKGKTKKISISRNAFRKILKLKETSIKQLGETYGICSDKTIRRSLNQGEMNPVFLDEIAEFLDVHPKLFSSSINIDRINHTTLKNYTYSTKTLEEARSLGIKEDLKVIFSLFDISYMQYDGLDYETQYNLQHGLFEAIYNVLGNYFSKDAYGNDGVSRHIINDLEFSRDDHYLLEYANTVLRKKYISNPPAGYSKKAIAKMSEDELIDLDMHITTSKEVSEENPLDKKYKNTSG